MKRISTYHYFLFFMIIFLVSAILYYEGQSIIDVLSKTKIKIALIVTFLNIPYIILAGLAFDKLCQIYEIQLHWVDWLGLSFATNFINQLLPYRPGMAFRFFYLHRHYKTPFSLFSIIMIAYFLLLLLGGFIFSLTGWIFIHSFSIHPLLYLAGGTLILAIALFFIVKKYYSFNAFVIHPFLLFIAFFYLIIMQLIFSIMLFYTFQALQESFSYLECFFMTGLLSIAMIFPITPANIGILETLLGTLTQMIANDFTIGFSAMALLRATQWIVSLFFGSIFSYILVGKFLPKS